MKEWQNNMVMAIAMTETGKDFSDNPLEVAELLVKANENENVRTALDKVLSWQNNLEEETAIDKILRDYIANPRKAKSGKIKKNVCKCYILHPEYTPDHSKYLTSEVMNFSNAIATPSGQVAFSNMYKVSNVMKAEGII